jgi:hypothetical protein
MNQVSLRDAYTRTQSNPTKLDLTDVHIPAVADLDVTQALVQQQDLKKLFSHAGVKDLTVSGKVLEAYFGLPTGPDSEAYSRLFRGLTTLKLVDCDQTRAFVYAAWLACTYTKEPTLQSLIDPFRLVSLDLTGVEKVSCGYGYGDQHCTFKGQLKRENFRYLTTLKLRLPPCVLPNDAQALIQFSELDLLELVVQPDCEVTSVCLQGIAKLGSLILRPAATSSRFRAAYKFVNSVTFPKITALHVWQWFDWAPPTENDVMLERILCECSLVRLQIDKVTSSRQLSTIAWCVNPLLTTFCTDDLSVRDRTQLQRIRNNLSKQPFVVTLNAPVVEAVPVASTPIVSVLPVLSHSSTVVSTPIVSVLPVLSRSSTTPSLIRVPTPLVTSTLYESLDEDLSFDWSSNTHDDEATKPSTRSVTPEVGSTSDSDDHSDIELLATQLLEQVSKAQ